MRISTKARVLRQLEVYGPDVAVNLAAELGLSKRCVYETLAELHQQGGVYVKDYMQLGLGPHTRVWAFGYGVDATRPAPKTCAERTSAYRRRAPARAYRPLNSWLRGLVPL